MRVRKLRAGRRAHLLQRDQILDEVSAFIDLLFEVYRDFGFTEVLVKLSTRPAAACRRRCAVGQGREVPGRRPGS